MKNLVAALVAFSFVTSLSLPSHAQDEPVLIRAADLSEWTSPPADHRVAYGTHPLQFGDLYLPVGPGLHPVVIFVHGGCWLSAYDIRHTARLARALADAGVAAWSIEYRRVGDEGGGWPGTFQDVENGAAHLQTIASEYGLDLDRVLAAGHSAGGHLALWLGARSTGAIDEAPFGSVFPIELQGVLALAPAPDLANLHQKQVCGHVIDQLMGGGPGEVPDRYKVADATRFAPIGLPQILVVGRFDTSWAPSGRHYFEVASAKEQSIRLVQADESGHFEMIDPDHPSFQLVLDKTRELLHLDQNRQ